MGDYFAHLCAIVLARRPSFILDDQAYYFPSNPRSVEKLGCREAMCG
jgi:hypothetical protein